MNILSIPLRNLRRKWLKSALLALVFALGVTSIVALDYVSTVVGHSLEKKLTAYGANILVMPRSEKLHVGYGGFSLGEMVLGVTSLGESEVEERVSSIDLKDRISVVAPKLVTVTRVHGSPVGLVGVRWEREKVLKGYWALDGAFPDTPDGLVAGASAAARLGLRPGMTLDLDGRPAMVSGVLLPTGGDDDGVLFAGMDFAQAVAGSPDTVSFVEVAALCAGCPIQDIVDQLRAALPDADIKALQAVVKQRMLSVDFVRHLVLTVSLVILFIACCMVGVTMLSSVNERIREIGLMRSLGFSRAGIFVIFCYEALLIGLAAALAGYAGGFLLSGHILRLLDLAKGAVVAFDPAHMAATCLLITAVSVLAAFFPAWKASSVEPSQALISL